MIGCLASISACPVLRWGEAAQVVSSLLRTNGANALRLAVDWGVWCRSTREAPVERFDFLTLRGWEWTRFDGAMQQLDRSYPSIRLAFGCLCPCTDHAFVGLLGGLACALIATAAENRLQQASCSPYSCTRFSIAGCLPSMTLSAYDFA